MPQLIDNLLSVRSNIASIFISRALRHHPEKAREVLESALHEQDQADAYAELDYRVFRGLAFASGNPIYGLILNGLKGLYTRVGRHYFSDSEARELARSFYQQLADMCSQQPTQEQVVECVRVYGRRSGEIWHSMQKNLPDDLGNKR